MRIRNQSLSMDFCRVCLDFPVGFCSGTLENSDDEDELGEPPEGLGVVCERVGLAREEDFVKVFVDPKLPSKRDVEMHYLMNHLPYRNWCPVCVKSKGKEMGHTRDKGGERDLPEYSWDFCFPGGELGFK